MALELKDRIYTDCVSTGTDDAWIGDPKEGYQGWEAITPNATVYYCITDDTSWEVGYGEYVNAFGAGDNADKAIKRNLISSNTGALLDLSGNASIFCTYPAEKSVYLDTDGNIQLPDTNVRFKSITGNEVISPVVATGAVIVDGTEAEGGDLAKLLDVYTKDEIQDKINDQDRKNTGKFMLQTGGKFTGEVEFDKTITLNNNFTQVRASVEKPFHTIKTNAPVNPDGSQNTDNPFGLAVDIDHNNTFKNQFVVQNRKGEILSIKGGGSPYGKLDFDWTYRGIINQDHHITNKEYVDNAINSHATNTTMHTLSSEGNKLNWALGKSLISTQWATDTNNPETAKIYYFYKLHDYTGDEVQLNKYKTTPSTMLEIWKQGNLIVKTSLVAFEESTYSTADTQARVSGLNVTTHADELFDSDSNYGIVISNLQLKEEV